MEREFWLERWNSNQIGFHEAYVNPLLTDHINKLALTPGGRLFLPLCGKTLDIGWLLQNDYSVVGCELSKVAVTDLFADLGLQANITETQKWVLYSAPGIDVYVGNIFDLTATTLGTVDGVYDRAALVALPVVIRDNYSSHLPAITHQAPQLLVTLEYDQTAMNGPPFSIPDQEVHERYGSAFSIQLLTSAEVEGGLKGRCDALEKAWLLSPLGTDVR